MRAGLAGLLAMAGSLLLEFLAATILGTQGLDGSTVLIAVGIGVAPWVEELAKWISLRTLRASWAGTGLAFGLYEGLIKLARGFGLAWELGALSSVLLHWGLGRMAGRARLGLLWAILLHTAFNALFMLGTVRRGGIVGVVMLGVAALLLALTFLRPRHAD